MSMSKRGSKGMSKRERKQAGAQEQAMMQAMSLLKGEGAQGVQMSAAFKEGWLWKRAQGVSALGRANWKKRYFTLRVGLLRYYDGEPSSPKAECKGMIVLPRVKAVEVADDAFGRTNLFQVAHEDAVLYIQAASADEREDWLLCIRKMCSHNTGMLTTVCPGYFTGKKWTCCGATAKTMPGCSPITNVMCAPIEPPPSSGAVAPSLPPPVAHTSSNSASTTEPPANPADPTVESAGTEIDTGPSTDDAALPSQPTTEPSGDNNNRPTAETAETIEAASRPVDDDETTQHNTAPPSATAGPEGDANGAAPDANPSDQPEGPCSDTRLVDSPSAATPASSIESVSDTHAGSRSSQPATAVQRRPPARRDPPKRRPPSWTPSPTGSADLPTAAQVAALVCFDEDDDDSLPEDPDEDDDLPFAAAGGPNSGAPVPAPATSPPGPVRAPPPRRTPPPPAAHVTHPPPAAAAHGHPESAVDTSPLTGLAPESLAALEGTLGGSGRRAASEWALAFGAFSAETHGYTLKPPPAAKAKAPPEPSVCAVLPVSTAPQNFAAAVKACKWPHGWASKESHKWRGSAPRQYNLMADELPGYVFAPKPDAFQDGLGGVPRDHSMVLRPGATLTDSEAPPAVDAPVSGGDGAANERPPDEVGDEALESFFAALRTESTEDDGVPAPPAAVPRRVPQHGPPPPRPMSLDVGKHLAAADSDSDDELEFFAAK